MDIMKEYFDYNCYGEKTSRNYLGYPEDVDIERDCLAKNLKVDYLGVLYYQYQESLKNNPYKVVLKLPNDTILTMSKKSFERKKLLNESILKTDSYAENLISEYLNIFSNICFLREVSISGYELSENFKNIRFDLKESHINLLESLSNAIADFIIVHPRTKKTIILAINGSAHHKKYDALWQEFQESGLATALNYEYVILNTEQYKSIKKNPIAQEIILRQISKIADVRKPEEIDIEYIREALRAKKVVLSILEEENESKSILSKEFNITTYLNKVEKLYSVAKNYVENYNLTI